MKVYTRVDDLTHIEIDPRGILEVYNCFGIKDDLKANEYRFDGGSKAWTKQVTKDTLAAELQFLDGKAAVEAYSTLDYMLMSKPDMPARERMLRKGEWENSNDDFMLKRFLGDADIDEAIRRAIYDKLCVMNKNNARQPFEQKAEDCRKKLLYDGGLISEEELDA